MLKGARGEKVGRVELWGGAGRIDGSDGNGGKGGRVDGSGGNVLLTETAVQKYTLLCL